MNSCAMSGALVTDDPSYTGRHSAYYAAIHDAQDALGRH